MKFEFPDTGEGVTEGTFLEWKIGEGDEIEEDQVVGEAETDKAVVEIPAPSDGTVTSLKVEPGDTVKVGEVIMELDTGEDEVEADEKGADEEPEEKSPEPGEDSEPGTTSEENIEEPSDAEQKESLTGGKVLALPKVRKLAEEKNVDLASIKTEKRITEEEVLEASGDSQYRKEDKTETSTEETQETEDSGEASEEEINVSKDIKATPSVRKLAREEGIDISKVEGSGRGGKVTREDVLSFEESDEKEAETEGKADKKVERKISGGSEKLSGLEKFVGEKMEESRFSKPHVTHVEKADVSRLVEIREEADNDVDAHLTYMPFIMKACMLASRKYPRMNAHYDGGDEVNLKSSYDFNIAVDTDRGLLVPRVDNVGEKSLVELAHDLCDIVERAQNNEVSREEMSPGSFSITNIGVIGGESFTPIINPPQTCIMGVGKIQETAEVVDGEVVPRMTVKLSFSYDHRVIDGATAARFVNEVVENLEKPEEMMVEI